MSLLSISRTFLVHWPDARKSKRRKRQENSVTSCSFGLSFIRNLKMLSFFRCLRSDAFIFFTDKHVQRRWVFEAWMTRACFDNRAFQANMTVIDCFLNILSGIRLKKLLSQWYQENGTSRVQRSKKRNERHRLIINWVTDTCENWKKCYRLSRFEFQRHFTYD